MRIWTMIKLIIFIVAIGYALFMQYQSVRARNLEYHLDNIDDPKNKEDLENQIHKSATVSNLPSYIIFIVVAILLFILPK